MKKLWERKERLAIFVIVAMFVLVSFTSISSIRLLQGNARVINYVGIVRGATQKLVKEEIMGWNILHGTGSLLEISDWYPDDALIARLDSIVDELLTGEGPHGLSVLQDEAYLANARAVQVHWAQLKGLISEVRTGAGPETLFKSSQEYFELVNSTVFSAEAYSEAQVARINSILIAVNGLFVILLALGLMLYVRGLAAKKQADVLGKIAYVDPLTRLDNRASCERLIAQYALLPEDKDITVFMFDMNDLKLTNDFLGHKGGDKVIGAFGAALQEAAGEYGFVGRYGGDEFFMLSEEGDESLAEGFLHRVRKSVEEYNERHANRLEKIQYAAGYVVANPSQTHISDIIHEADNRMYADKRKPKSVL
ncbi:MAG: GGDEF domain-containing protein [Clostridiales bacterium]|nr:GGDEF domain-containing protein [Clostridiales bacterium]